MKYWILLIIIVSCQSQIKRPKPLKTKHENANLKCKLDSLSKYSLINNEAEILDFLDITHGNYVLLLTYTESVCRPCLEQYFNLLNTLSDDIDKNKIILIARYSTPRAIVLDAKQSGLKSYNLQIDEECDEIKGFIEQYPRLILVNPKLEILNNRYGFPGDSINNPKFIEILPYLKGN